MPYLPKLKPEEMNPQVRIIYNRGIEEFPDLKGMLRSYANIPHLLEWIVNTLTYYKKSSPLDNNLQELGVVAMSNLTKCGTCVSIHTQRVIKAGYSDAQIEVLDKISLGENPSWGDNTLFNIEESSVISLAYHLAWSSVYGRERAREVYEQRHKTQALLEKHFPRKQALEWPGRLNFTRFCNELNKYYEIEP